MTFYTELFNGIDENADNTPSPYDSLKDVPFRGNGYASDSYNHDATLDYGIPTDAEARRDRAATSQNTLPDSRNHETMLDYGIPTDAEARRNRAIREGHEREQRKRENLDETLSDRLDTIETNYVESRTDLSGRKMVEQNEPMSKRTAQERIFNSDSAKELESYIDVLQNDPYAIEELFYQGFGIANKARATSYGEYNPKNLSEATTQQLKNFISFFASAVERGVRFPSQFRNGVTLSDKGSSYPPVSELVVPLGVAIDEIANMVEEKGTGETSVDNPINELSGANGKEKIGVRELADLAIKAQLAGHKLSADTINFPA